MELESATVKSYAEITRNVINKYSVMNLDMKELLEDLDIMIYETETQDYENNLTINKRDGSYYLTVRKDIDLNENKFSICSEIGNLIMHYESFDFRYMNQFKYESNEFAANFLLPEGLFKQSITDNYDASTNNINLEGMSADFGLPIKLITRRGQLLGLFP